MMTTSLTPTFYMVYCDLSATFVVTFEGADLNYAPILSTGSFQRILTTGTQYFIDLILALLNRALLATLHLLQLNAQVEVAERSS